jgi:hypothetical protein
LPALQYRRVPPDGAPARDTVSLAALDAARGATGSGPNRMR